MTFAVGAAGALPPRHPQHKLDRLPHAEALADPQLLDRVLGDPGY